MLLAPVKVHNVLIAITNLYRMVITLVTHIPILVYNTNNHKNSYHNQLVKTEEGDHDCLEPTITTRELQHTEGPYSDSQISTNTEVVGSDADSV